MGQLVSPKVFLIGYTGMSLPELEEYLRYTGNEEFLESLRAAQEAGINDGEILCTVASKLCYRSLTLGKNSNVTRTRDIPSNFQNCLSVGHLSVIEHCQLNFIITNCSRVLTHECVRHRLASYSQTSGRYCRLDHIDLVWDPILEPVRARVLGYLHSTEDLVYLMECDLGLRKPPSADSRYYGLTSASQQDEPFYYTPDQTISMREREGKAAWDRCKWVPDDSFNFEKRKKLTSAIRRIAPNGQSNELFMSFNLRTLRHVVQMRTARHAEREIRDVFGQVYRLVRDKFPLTFCDAQEREYDGLLEIYGMRSQPYELAVNDPQSLDYFSTDMLRDALARRAVDS